eukprot:COSAG02_NODE_14986_length_1217_cov_4.347048_1_plen_28_part_10
MVSQDLARGERALATLKGAPAASLRGQP